MRTYLAILALALAIGGCAEDSPSREPADAVVVTSPAVERPAAKRPASPRKGTRIKVGDSEFGRMLFGGNGRAIYIFENDRRRRTVCYGECARAWPPVLTKGRPVAGPSVSRSLLGTIRRRGGRRQVTYAGRPLYFYAHEAPGQVLCHNVDLNGGLWWVVGPDGRRRP